MKKSEKKPACAQTTYFITPKDIPLSCPTEKMELWNAHPKVYLPIEETGVEVCPYCGARYELKESD
ncbi:zinc-finger domain-containing protein [Legionella impletisoli]|uniref:Zinc-finger domain-containing protein n=1 Tax=Legionella impletisoli TaxID=343510 RepID=A0A917NC54_9GAMM|nr:zinc-finger domain-containing protein [Legionella impletisoli]GGI83089.1 zinc-finger domain-containing protein [Legionella impletisoli]